MNKSELAAKIAAELNISNMSASRVIDAFTSLVTESLSQGEAVSLVGFGTFEVRDRSARTGRNPRTGEAIQIPAKKVVKFTAGKSLKESVNN